jgi:cobaltochelatase CobT
LSDSVRSTIQKRDAKGAIRHGGEWLTLWSDPDSMKTRAELRQEAAARSAALTVEHQLAAAARSLAGDPWMQIAFGASGEAGGAMFAAESVGSSDEEVLSARRGEIDAYALTRRFHQTGLHRSLAPTDASEKALFDLCEQVRCEAIGALRFRGVAGNLVAAHRARLRKSDLLNAHLASLIPLAEGLRMVLRDSLLSAPDPSIASSGFWMWDRWLRARFSSHLIGLRASAGDQSAFAALSRNLIEGLIAELGSLEGRGRRFQPTANHSGAGPENGRESDRLTEDSQGDVFEPGGSLFLEGGADPLARLLVQEEPVKAPVYAPFTTAHDLVVRSTELVDPAVVRKERAALEQRRAEFRRDFSRIVARLQRKLFARQMRNWSFDRDEGLVDASRLDRVVVNPGFASAYKQEEESEFRNSVVSILIDNSGSMRGKPIEIACLVSDMISAALERCGVACEILGFTTRGWKGGQSALDWARAGSPENPGRLNDTLHIVYKAADEPVRRSRLAICAMMEASLLKENIDGEALLWASRRLILRPESRKVLIVISDGAPVDQATLEENADKEILDRHLREVIAEIETSGSIELAAIGVKHEAAKYYRNNAQIEKIDKLGEQLVRMVDVLLSR